MLCCLWCNNRFDRKLLLSLSSLFPVLFVVSCYTLYNIHAQGSVLSSNRFDLPEFINFEWTISFLYVEIGYYWLTLIVLFHTIQICTPYIIYNYNQREILKIIPKCQSWDNQKNDCVKVIAGDNL